MRELFFHLCKKALKGAHCRLELSYLLPSDETFHDFRRLLLDNVDMMSYDMPIGGEHCQDITMGYWFFLVSDFSEFFKIWNLYSWSIKTVLTWSGNFKNFEWLEPYVKTKFDHFYAHKCFSIISRRVNTRPQSQYAVPHVKSGKSTKIRTE